MAKKPLTELQRELVSANHLLAPWVVKTYYPELNGADSDDLVCDAYAALVDAGRCYDPEKGVKFSTYATWCIRKRCWTELRAQAERRRMEINGYAEGIPLSKLIYRDSGAEERDEQRKRINRLRRVLNNCDEREREILKGVYGIGGEKKSCEVIGAELGLTKQRVHQLKGQAERRVRKAVC